MLRLTTITIINMLSLYSLGRLLKARRRGTAAAQPSAIQSTTTASPSAVQVQASTQVGTPASSQSAPSAIESGRAALFCWCVVPAYHFATESLCQDAGKLVMWAECNRCHASGWFALTPAPAVAPATLTYQTPASGISVASDQGDATSQSSGLSNCNHQWEGNAGIWSCSLCGEPWPYVDSDWRKFNLPRKPLPPSDPEAVF